MVNKWLNHEDYWDDMGIIWYIHGMLMVKHQFLDENMASYGIFMG